jgi:plasmid stabilization system protein ParE
MTQGAVIQRSQSVDTGTVFKDRFYHAAKVAQQIDGGINTHNSLNKVIHGSLHGEEHDILRQSNQSSIASSKPESIRHNGLLPSDLERNTEKASSSVEKLLEKLAAALNSKDNPDAALQEIDSILRKERQGLGEGKHIHTMQATIMEDETLEDSNADEFAHVKDEFSDDEDEDYSDDDSTVSSITNPTYHESFQRHSPRSRAYGPVYQTGPQKGLPLPSAKPVSLTHPKVLEQYISSKRYDERLNTRFHGHEDVVHVQLDRSKNTSMEGKGEISGLESSLPPVKAFSEKGRSMNNKGLVNQIKGWDDLEEDDGSYSKNPRGVIDVKDPSPPFSPSDRLKRLANAATKYEQRQNLRHRRRGVSATPERNRVFYPSGDDMNKGKEQYDPFDTNSDDWESIPGFDFFKSEQESLAQAFHGNSFASKSIPEQVSELRRQQRERNSHAHRMDVLDQSYKS